MYTFIIYIYVYIGSMSFWPSRNFDCSSYRSFQKQVAPKQAPICYDPGCKDFQKGPPKLPRQSYRDQGTVTYSFGSWTSTLTTWTSKIPTMMDPTCTAYTSFGISGQNVGHLGRFMQIELGQVYSRNLYLVDKCSYQVDGKYLEKAAKQEMTVHRNGHGPNQCCLVRSLRGEGYRRQLGEPSGGLGKTREYWRVLSYLHSLYTPP